MTKTIISAVGSRKKVFVSISFVLLILLLAVSQARAQWPYPWPDSSHLPAGASQSGNVFPGGNLWGGGTLYTPANLPQRYMKWSFENDPGLPKIYGPLDPTMANYRDSHGTHIVGCDMYNFDAGTELEETNSLPISASDPRWDRHRNGDTIGVFCGGLPGGMGRALDITGNRLILLHINNPQNNDPNTETHVWMSFKCMGYYFDPESVDLNAPLAIGIFGPNSVVDGWYHDPAEIVTEQWSWFGFAVTFTNNSDSVTLGIASVTDSDIFVDDLQIALVSTPEPGTWGLVAFGGLVLIVSRRLRGTTGRT